MNKSYLKFLFITGICIIFLLLAGCPMQENTKNNDKKDKKEKDDGDENEIINIGINRGDNAYKLNILLSGSLQNPAWSPDGKSIVFTRFRNGYNEEPADIYTYNTETGVLMSGDGQ